LLKNPANGGTPAIASAAEIMVQNVQGIFRRKPPMFLRSCSPESA
jgi:hypothetical protein